MIDLRDLEQQGLEIFGLPPKFSGLRWIAIHGSGPLQLGLAHGDPRRDPRAVVTVGAISRINPQGIDIYGTLATMLALAENEAPANREGTLELEEWTRDLLEGVSGPEAWVDADLWVSGEQRDFQLLRGIGGWTAVRQLDCMWLYVQSLRGEPSEIELERVRDLRPYIQGTATFSGE